MAAQDFPSQRPALSSNTLAERPGTFRGGVTRLSPGRGRAC
jgi:hypothetical protein